MIEAVASWVFGFALGGAIAAGIGRPLVAECGPKVIPPIAICGVLLGAGLGWAINIYFVYIHATTPPHP